MHDEVEIITTRGVESQFPITRIYEYEENIEDLITNSKPKEVERNNEIWLLLTYLNYLDLSTREIIQNKLNIRNDIIYKSVLDWPSRQKRCLPTPLEPDNLLK